MHCFTAKLLIHAYQKQFCYNWKWFDQWQESQIIKKKKLDLSAWNICKCYLGCFIWTLYSFMTSAWRHQNVNREIAIYTLYAAATLNPFNIALLWLIRQWSPIVFKLPLTLPWLTTCKSQTLYYRISDGLEKKKKKKGKEVWRRRGGNAMRFER